MNLFRNAACRVPVIAIGALAWLAISNHCAISAAGGAAKMPMANCHGTSPANHSPARHDQQSGVECCKVLRATLLTPSSKLIKDHPIVFASHDYIVALIAAADGLRLTCLIEWDTGPPGADSFAESVLQRSILAHAPPSLA